MSKPVYDINTIGAYNVRDAFAQSKIKMGAAGDGNVVNLGITKNGGHSFERGQLVLFVEEDPAAPAAVGASVTAVVKGSANENGTTPVTYGTLVLTKGADGWVTSAQRMRFPVNPLKYLLASFAAVTDTNLIGKEAAVSLCMS